MLPVVGSAQGLIGDAESRAKLELSFRCEEIFSELIERFTMEALGMEALSGNVEVPALGRKRITPHSSYSSSAHDLIAAPSFAQVAPPGT